MNRIDLFNLFFWSMIGAITVVFWVMFALFIYSVLHVLGVA